MGALTATTAMFGLSAFQTYSGYSAEKAQGRYQQSIADSNIRTANRMAEDAIRRGTEDANTVRRRTSQIRGSQRVALAVQGIDIESGSAADVLSETDEMGALDELTARNNGWREAWGYRSQAAEYASQARFSKLATRARVRNTLLTGGLRALEIGSDTWSRPSSSPTSSGGVSMYGPLDIRRDTRGWPNFGRGGL